MSQPRDHSLQDPPALPPEFGTGPLVRKNSAITEPAWVRWLLIGSALGFLSLFLLLPLASVFTEALRDGWREKEFTMNELSKAAAVCRVSRVIQPYVEMLA